MSQKAWKLKSQIIALNAALEEAASFIERTDLKSLESNPSYLRFSLSIISTYVAGIRAMKDDGYGADNPNTTDWRRPLLTKVEVLRCVQQIEGNQMNEQKIREAFEKAKVA